MVWFVNTVQPGIGAGAVSAPINPLLYWSAMAVLVVLYLLITIAVYVQKDRGDDGGDDDIHE